MKGFGKSLKGIAEEIQTESVNFMTKVQEVFVVGARVENDAVYFLTQMLHRGSEDTLILLAWSVKVFVAIVEGDVASVIQRLQVGIMVGIINDFFLQADRNYFGNEAIKAVAHCRQTFDMDTSGMEGSIQALEIG